MKEVFPSIEPNLPPSREELAEIIDEIPIRQEINGLKFSFVRWDVRDQEGRSWDVSEHRDLPGQYVKIQVG